MIRDLEGGSEQAVERSRHRHEPVPERNGPTCGGASRTATWLELMKKAGGGQGGGSGEDQRLGHAGPPRLGKEFRFFSRKMYSKRCISAFTF